MGVSIYYAARRRAPLCSSEISGIEAIIELHSVDDLAQRFLSQGTGLNWESFDHATNSEASRFLKRGLVFSGSTKLPDNHGDATWIGLQHWCTCLSAIRRSLPGADWSVSVDDHEIVWDAALSLYDPSL